MKIFKQVLLVAVVTMLPLVIFAQAGMEDVIYLKDGSIYRGIIIEQVPNVSMKIQTLGGNVFAVQIADVTKIAKEQKVADPLTTEQQYGNKGWGHWRKDTTAFAPRKKGYFNQVQVLLENTQGGVRVINGYKFGRLGYLGIGIGFDRVWSSPFNKWVNGLEDKALEGIYLPLYLFYSGDILNKRITPYYTVEAGYAMAFDGIDNQYETDGMGRRPIGGAMGGVGLGVKINSRRHKGHFSILFNLNFKQVNYEKNVMTFDSNGNAIGLGTVDSYANLLFPGIRFGIGF